MEWKKKRDDRSEKKAINNSSTWRKDSKCVQRTITDRQDRSGTEYNLSRWLKA
jgi:hypothetical protein